jgi:hypothetical protein
MQAAQAAWAAVAREEALGAALGASREEYLLPSAAAVAARIQTAMVVVVRPCVRACKQVSWAQHARVATAPAADAAVLAALPKSKSGRSWPQPSGRLRRLKPVEVAVAVAVQTVAGVHDGTRSGRHAHNCLVTRTCTPWRVSQLVLSSVYSRARTYNCGQRCIGRSGRSGMVAEWVLAVTLAPAKLVGCGSCRPPLGNPTWPRREGRLRPGQLEPVNMSTRCVAGGWALCKYRCGNRTFAPLRCGKTGEVHIPRIPIPHAP